MSYQELKEIAAMLFVAGLALALVSCYILTAYI
jgi:hypothetical protein